MNVNDLEERIKALDYEATYHAIAGDILQSDVLYRRMCELEIQLEWLRWWEGDN